MSPRRINIVAIAVGVLVFGVPSAVFNYRLNGSVERQSQEEMNLGARRIIALAEGRISRAIAILDELAARGVNSCEPAHLDALRQATFTTTPVKELSVIAPDGTTLCSDLSGPLEGRAVISSEPAGPGTDVLLEVVRLGRRPGHIVRINRPGTGSENGLAALIPTELLVPQVSTQGGPVGMNSRIFTVSGTLIGEYIVLAENFEKTGENLGVDLKSDHYTIDAMLSLPRTSLTARQNDLRAFGAIMTGVLALLTFAVALMLPKRQRDNPIVAIEKALKDGEFVPYYQPVVDIRTGQLRGAEVLMRWRKPDGSIILPGVFIPLAESSGLILDLTRAIMRQVSKEMGPVYANRAHLKIGFNLVARHFADEDIVQDVNDIFKNSSVRLSQIVLEMTERQPIENLAETRRVIAALQGLGVLIALDDVGTGHSGLSYMLKLGVDIIKIDKMFVDSIGIDRNSTAIVETLVDLAANMRMEIVAEGVENFEQVVHLRNLGIRAAQGYVFAPPLPSSSFIQLLEAIDPLPKRAAEGQVSTSRRNPLRRAQVA